MSLTPLADLGSARRAEADASPAIDGAAARDQADVPARRPSRDRFPSALVAAIISGFGYLALGGTHVIFAKRRWLNK